MKYWPKVCHVVQVWRSPADFSLLFIAQLSPLWISQNVMFAGQGRCHNTALKCPGMDQTLHRVTIEWDHWVRNVGLCAYRYSDLMTCCNLLFVIPRSQSLPHFGHHQHVWSLRVKREGLGGVTGNKAHFCGQQTINANVKTRLKLHVFAGECQSIRQSDLQFPCHL